MKKSEFRILGKTIEEFLIQWNVVTFQLGRLNKTSSKKLSKNYIKALKKTLEPFHIDLETFFINLSRMGSISLMKMEDATTPEKIKQFYSQNLWGTSIPYTLPIALEMAPDLEGKTVLDIGCGFGRLALLCALHKASRVVAVDLSTPLIKTFESIISLLKIDNIETHIMDVENLKLEPNQFDVIFCCEVIEHLLNPAKLLKTIYSLLKPDGIVVLSTPNGLNLCGFKQAIYNFFHKNWVSPYGLGQPELHLFTPLSLRNLLSKANLSTQEIRGAELLDNLGVLFPSYFAMGIISFLTIFIPFFQKIKRGLIRLAKTRWFKYFGLEIFISGKKP